MTGEFTFTLDPQQAAVASAPAVLRQYVTAGPGSGKTEVVSARVSNLLNVDGLPSDSILVVSFSRAAVEAIQARLRAGGVHGAVWITTLDSLASRILLDRGVETEGLGFDRRIVEASRIIATSAPDLPDCLADIEHVIVDEVQDVVGIRADFLAAVMAALGPMVGFTLFGDECQAIYDFQKLPGSLDAESLKTEAVHLGALVTSLRGQYRAQTRDAITAMGMRPTRVEDWASELEAYVHRMSVIPREDLAEWLQRTDGTVAVLTQTNAQALCVAHDLWTRGIPADIQNAPIERPLEPWVAQILASATSIISRTEFGQLASDADPDSVQARWMSLRRLTSAKQPTLNVRDVARCLAAGSSLSTLLLHRSRIVVSTVHRAKGLEFDRVLLLDPATWHPDEDRAVYARTLYVAVTRPKYRLFRIESPAESAGWRRDPKLDRVVKHPWKKHGLIGIEVRGIDWCALDPAVDEARAGQAQATLTRLEDRGPVPVQVRLDPRQSTLQRPAYVAYADGQPLGTFSDAFIDTFLKGIGSIPQNWPTFSGLYMIGTQTVVGPPSSRTIGKNGLLLAPIIAGPASLDWNQ